MYNKITRNCALCRVVPPLFQGPTWPCSLFPLHYWLYSPCCNLLSTFELGDRRRNTNPLSSISQCRCQVCYWKKRSGSSPPSPFVVLCFFLICWQHYGCVLPFFIKLMTSALSLMKCSPYNRFKDILIQCLTMIFNIFFHRYFMGKLEELESDPVKMVPG